MLILTRLIFFNELAFKSWTKNIYHNPYLNFKGKLENTPPSNQY